MNVLHITYLVCCVVALCFFFGNRKKYGINLYWFVPVLILPMSVALIFASARYRATEGEESVIRRKARRGVTAASVFLAASLLAVFVPAVAVYYFVLDGSSEALISRIPCIESVSLVAVCAVYGLYLLLCGKKA